MSQIPTVLSACGVSMPALVYGTAWKQERTAAMVEQALRAGFRGIDTACQPKHYHEAGAGSGLAAWIAQGGSRDQVYLQTKFTPLDGQDPKRLPYDPKVRLSDQVRQSVQTSLANLQTARLDGLVLHSPLPTRDLLMEVWSALESRVADGNTLQLGISNCYAPSELEFLYHHARIKPAVVQNRFYAATGYDREIRAFCREHGIVYQSFWTLTANQWLLHHPDLAQLAETHRRSPAQILFRFLTQSGVVPLTGTTSPDHMKEDLEIFEFQLSTDEVARLDRLL